MILDLRPLLRGETEKIDVDYYIAPNSIDGISFDGDVHVLGQVTDNAGYMKLVLRADVKYVGECARCLDKVEGVLTLDFERAVAAEGSLSDEDDGVYDDGYAVIRDGRLDIDEELKEEILLSFPSKLLCSEDCLGLCPKCGKLKRLGDCGCSTREINPAFAVLQQLLQKNGDEQDNEKK